MAEPSSMTTTKHLFDALKQLYDPVDIAKTERPLRYVIYARKSTDDSEKQTRSLGDQLSECMEFVDKNNLVLGRPQHIQEAVSAKVSDKREGFRTMIEAIKKGQYDGIIAWHPDRLARNMKDAGEIIDLLDKSTIKDLRFVSFNFENTPSGKMHLGITFVLSKQYSDQLSVNVSRGISHSIEDGDYINRPKHGYYKDPAQRLRPDGRNHGLIKDAFRLRLEGNTFDQIAEYLNSQHYERAYSDGTHKQYTWRKQEVQKRLTDPVYAGVVAYGDGHIADLTEIYDFVPAVSVADFVKLNRLKGGSEDLAKIARRFRKGEDVKADLLRGKVFCAECEDACSSGITPKKDKRGVTNYFYYRCETDGCKRYGKSTRAKVVIDYVNEFLAKKPFSSKATYEHYALEMKMVEAERAKGRRALLNTLLGKEKALATKQERLKEFIIEPTNKDFIEEFKGDLLKVETEHAQVEADIKKLKGVIEAQKSAILLMPEFLEHMEKVAQIIATTKNMVELDFCIKKMFSNFFVDRKNVVFATLSEPFAHLVDPKTALGARCRTRTCDLLSVNELLYQLS
jgi:site-specific DNA recombinase